MKTQIIQLNQNDDFLSVRDKLNWSQTGRIILVWPDNENSLNSQLDLTLLKRHADSMGSQLALVTRNSVVRYIARQLGISSFRNLHQAQDRTWEIRPIEQIDNPQDSHRVNRERIRNHNHLSPQAGIENPIIRILCLGLSVLAVLLLAGYILPGAKITLSPRVEIQTMKFDLTVDPAEKSVNLSTGSLATYNLEVIVQGHDTITTTGSMIFPDEPAIGNLKFTNSTKQAINLPAGTIVTTQGKDPVRFIILSEADVTIGASKSEIIAARAVKLGTSGNLQAKKLVVIEGKSGLGLTVSNPAATYGGSDATVPTPATQDIQIIKTRIEEQLKQSALTELQSILPAQDVLVSPTLTMVETLVESSYPSLGEPGNQLEMTMQVRFQSQVVSGEVLRRLVTPFLDSVTPAGYASIDNSLEISQFNQPSREQDGTIHWMVSTNRKLQVSILPFQVIEIIKGITVAEAKQRLFTSLPLDVQPRIELSPSWWPRLPYLAMRIQVYKAGTP